MKLAFFGTSDRSIPILNTLKKHFELTFCVTKDDTKIGRKQEIKETEVKKWAKANEIPYLTINSLKNETIQVVMQTLKEKDIDLAIVADFSFMIPQEIIDIPKFKIINIHFSLLPSYRGASPIQHAILNGDNVTGITYYIMDKGMDTGDILYQISYKLIGNETSELLYSALFKKAAENLPLVINKYTKGEIIPQKQDHSKATYCYSKTNPKVTFIEKDDAHINWQDSIEKIDSLVRAFIPWPIAWTTLGELETGQNISLKSNVNRNLKIRIYETSVVDKKLVLKRLQIEGKSITDYKSFENGYLEK